MRAFDRTLHTQQARQLLSVGNPEDLSLFLIEMQPNRTLARPALFNYRLQTGA